MINKLTKWMNQVLMNKSSVDIQAHNKAGTFHKKASDASELWLLDADARENLTTKNGNISNITNKDICAILLAYYGKVDKERKHLQNVLVTVIL